jgi:hypothetical protein
LLFISNKGSPLQEKFGRSFASRFVSAWVTQA